MKGPDRIQYVDAAGRCLREAACQDTKTRLVLRRLAVTYLCRALDIEPAMFCPMRAA